MRILCVTPSYWPAFQYGGPIFVNHYLNVALIKSGIDVIVYTTNVGLGRKVPENEEIHVDGVKVIYFSITRVLECLGATGWQYSWRMTDALKKSLRHFDLVNLNAIWNYPSAAAAFLCRVHHVPYVVTAHGALYPYTLSSKRWKKLPYYYLVARQILTGASAVHYTGADEADKCHSRLALRNRAVVVPYVIDLSEFDDILRQDTLSNRFRIPKGRKTVLFLGRINWKKGLDILIKAFALVEKQRDDVHLLIVGNDEGGFERQVKNMISDCGMQYEDQGTKVCGLESRQSNPRSKITFAGMLTGNEKIAAYTGSDIFVLPSYSENFGVVVVEAMACGIPVIVSDQVGIHREIAESKAGIVTRTDPKQLAEAMVTLLENPEMCRQMGRNGKKLLEEKFAPNKVANRMIETYQSLVGQSWRTSGK